MASDVTEAASSVRCVVCRDRVLTTAARFDSEQEGAVCPECLTNLRWAQARLKEKQIVGCAVENKIEWKD